MIGAADVLSPRRLSVDKIQCVKTKLVSKKHNSSSTVKCIKDDFSSRNGGGSVYGRVAFTPSIHFFPFTAHKVMA